jgi:hypothetical protein
MKHIIFSAFCLASTWLSAQLCKPDTTIKVPGFYPSKLADGSVGVAYNQTVMILSFKDTSAVVGGSKQKVTIDSLKLTKVIGLPAGMGYVCYEPRCVYLPSAVRCITLNGTPTQSGLFPLKFAVTAYAKVNGFFPVAQPDTIREFSILVTGNSSSVVSNDIQKLSVYPNPSSHIIYVAHASGSKPSMTQITGAFVSLDWREENGVWIANTQHLSSGVYRVSVGGVNRTWIKE